jgi:hypothetical protein
MRYGQGKLKVMTVFIEPVPAGQALLPMKSGFSGYYQDTILAVNVGICPLPWLMFKLFIAIYTACGLYCPRL